MSATQRLQKPLMRGLFHKQLARTLATAFVVTVSTGIAVRVLLGNRRKATYAEFYKNYDIEKEFDEMRLKGVFQSAK